MSWISTLYRTYENNSNIAGKVVGNMIPLSVVSHSVENAHLTIMLNDNGDFIDAIEVDKENGKTIIPVTEKSSSRSSGIAPHGLCDQLPYIAGDYSKYIASKDEKDKVVEKYKAYINQLSNWTNSNYGNAIIKLIYRYLQKAELLKDLIGKGLVEVDNNGYLISGKISKTPYDKVLVRFCVHYENKVINCWDNSMIFDSFQKFYITSQDGKNGICYIEGDTSVLSENHPKGIVAASYGAKLISCNDNTNFSFRGRFLDSNEALSIGYEASQKIHAVLSWLASNQGIQVGKKDKRTYICWNPNGKRVPQVIGDFDIFGDMEEENQPNTSVEYKRKLWKVLKGYHDILQDHDEIVMISLEAATTGRLSVTYYNELKASDFLNRIEDWGNRINWKFINRKKNDKTFYRQIETPKLEDIVLYAYGVERNNLMEVNDKILREHTQRLLHIMLSKGQIPRDLVKSLFDRASTPLSYKSYWNYEKLLSITCAIVTRKLFVEKTDKGDKYDMSYDQYENDRSFLYGKLLAIYEKIERDTYGEGEERATNAQRLQTMYVNYPARARMIIENQLTPYFRKLSKLKSDTARMTPSDYYKSLISKIDVKLVEFNRNELNKKLSETYLVGYYLQREDFYKKKNNDKGKNMEEV